VKRGTRIAIGAALAITVVGLVGSLAIPMRTVKISVDLPPPINAKPTPRAKPVFIAMETDGRLTIEGKASTLETLPQDLTARFAAVPRDEQRVLIEMRGKSSPDRLMAVIDRLQGHGWKIGLIGREDASGGLTISEGTE